MNPHNLAILPSELEQKKKSGVSKGELKMPWEVAPGGHQTKKSSQNQTPLVQEASDDDSISEEEDAGADKGVAEGVPGTTKKKFRKSNQHDVFEAEMGAGDAELPLLGSVAPQMDLGETESMKLGSHLFNEEDPIMSAAEAVAILHGMGYEAVSDVNYATPFHTSAEIEGDNTMNDEVSDAPVQPKTMVEEVTDQ